MKTDHQLKTDVLAELAWEPSISADHIGVTAKNGVVTLSGHVDTYWQKMAAETAAGRVKGVKALAEEIEVRLPLHIKHGDDEIATAALNRMAWDVSVPQDAIRVKVEKGHVTLTGTGPVLPKGRSRLGHPPVDGCYRRVQPDHGQAAPQQPYHQR
jgi:osmotically-inducible protein OsmY